MIKPAAHLSNKPIDAGRRRRFGKSQARLLVPASILPAGLHHLGCGGDRDGLIWARVAHTCPLRQVSRCSADYPPEIRRYTDSPI